MIDFSQCCRFQRLFCFVLNLKNSDEFNAHLRFGDGCIPGLVTQTVRDLCKKVFAQLNFTEPVPAGSAAMELNCFPICLTVGGPRGSSQVGTNALRGGSFEWKL